MPPSNHDPTTFLNRPQPWSDDDSWSIHRELLTRRRIRLMRLRPSRVRAFFMSGGSQGGTAGCLTGILVVIGLPVLANSLMAMGLSAALLTVFLLIVAALLLRRRGLRRAARRVVILNECCPQCSYPLWNLPPFATNPKTGRQLAVPAVCPECAYPWPTVPKRTGRHQRATDFGSAKSVPIEP